MAVRNSLKYLSRITNNTAVSAREIQTSRYNELCNQLAKELDDYFRVVGSRVFMLNPDSGQNDDTWPITFKSDNVSSTLEIPTTRIELFSQTQTQNDWLCKKQVNGQAFRLSSTTLVPTIYCSSSVLDQETGLVRYVLKTAVPYL